jgi:hypothetical protein
VHCGPFALLGDSTLTLGQLIVLGGAWTGAAIGVGYWIGTKDYSLAGAGPITGLWGVAR